jgi:hypothetical protein
MKKNDFKFRSFFMDDKFIEQNSIAKMREESDLGVNNIVSLIVQNLGL